MPAGVGGDAVLRPLRAPSPRVKPTGDADSVAVELAAFVADPVADAQVVDAMEV